MILAPCAFSLSTTPQGETTASFNFSVRNLCYATAITFIISLRDHIELIAPKEKIFKRNQWLWTKKKSQRASFHSEQNTHCAGSCFLLSFSVNKTCITPSFSSWIVTNAPLKLIPDPACLWAKSDSIISQVCAVCTAQAMHHGGYRGSSSRFLFGLWNSCCRRWISWPWHQSCLIHFQFCSYRKPAGPPFEFCFQSTSRTRHFGFLFNQSIPVHFQAISTQFLPIFPLLPFPLRFEARKRVTGKQSSKLHDKFTNWSPCDEDARPLWMGFCSWQLVQNPGGLLSFSSSSRRLLLLRRLFFSSSSFFFILLLPLMPSCIFAHFVLLLFFYSFICFVLVMFQLIIWFVAMRW